MEDEADGKKMPLLDHLIELRRRLLYCVVTFFVAFGVSFYFSKELFAFLVRPLDQILGNEPGRHLIYTELTEVFFTYVKVAAFFGAFVSFPVFASQIWLFVAPGLYKNEKKAFLPFLIATPVLFFMGGALVYYVLFPVAWRFFLSFETPGGPGMLPIQLEAKVNEYLALVMKLIFAFGLSFELPVLMTLLARAGIATSKGMAEKRRYAIVIVFIVAAIFTPPDPLSQISLALPLLALWELSILSAKWVEKQRAERERLADQGNDLTVK